MSNLELDSGFIEKVLVFFGIDQKIQIKENSSILLTQDFSKTSSMTFANQKKMYQLIVDYFVSESRLVIIPHPNDLIGYDHLFPEASVIKKKIPLELIPFVFNVKPQTLMTLSMTSVNKLMGHFENCIRFSPGFEKYFMMTHQYFSVGKIINEFFGNYEIYEMNSDKLLLEKLLTVSGKHFARSIQSVKDTSQIPSNSIVIIDDIDQDMLPDSKQIKNFLTNVDRETLVIFINSNKEYLFYDYPNKEIFQHIVPIEIIRSSTIDETDPDSETIFVYSKRKDWREMINQQSFEKTLESSNEIIKVAAMSEEQLRIKILEGILEATEKRLEHYIKIEAELREKVNFLTSEMT